MSKLDSRKVLSELSDLMKTYSNYSDYTEKRGKSLSGQSLFLDGKACPSGASPCDPSTRECPDEEHALEPAMYNSDGLRCYANVNLRKPRAPQTIKSQHVQIMEFVEASAKLAAMLADKLKKVECADMSSENLCGMKNTCGWANGVCAQKSSP